MKCCKGHEIVVGCVLKNKHLRYYRVIEISGELIGAIGEYTTLEEAANSAYHRTLLCLYRSVLNSELMTVVSYPSLNVKDKNGDTWNLYDRIPSCVKFPDVEPVVIQTIKNSFKEDYLVAESQKIYNGWSNLFKANTHARIPYFGKSEKTECVSTKQVKLPERIDWEVRNYHINNLKNKYNQLRDYIKRNSVRITF